MVNVKLVIVFQYDYTNQHIGRLNTVFKQLIRSVSGFASSKSW